MPKKLAPWKPPEDVDAEDEGLVVPESDEGAPLPISGVANENGRVKLPIDLEEPQGA